MAGEKTTPAPPTEVIPGPRRAVNAADVAPSNEGLPGPVTPEPDDGGLIQLPPVPTESLNQPTFEIDEAGQPIEPPATEPEVTHDPLKDTKAALTKAQQELAQQKLLTQAILTNREFSGQREAPPAQPPEWATDKYLPEELPTADPEWPSKYIKRQFTVREIQQREAEDRKDVETFARQNKDFPEYIEDMRLIAAQHPGVYQGPRAVPVLYEIAKRERRIKELEGGQAQARDNAIATGAQLAKQSAGQPFVSPKSGGGSVPGAFRFPANFYQLSSADQKKLLVQAGLFREE